MKVEGSKGLKVERSKGLKVEGSKGRRVKKSRPFDPLTLRPLDKKIKDFLKKHHVLTIATASNNVPWVAHCFYAFMEDQMCLVFTTDDDTEHGKQMIENPNVSVGIAWETKIVGQIRGAQISGQAIKVKRSKGQKVERSVEESNDLLPLRPFDSSAAAKTAYLRRFPYAALLKTNLWIIQIETIKYTDNRLGFGTKLFWEREKKSR